MPRLALWLSASVLGAVLLASSAPGAGPIAKPRWLTGVTITEYWPVPERWYAGRLVAAPGLPGLHRVDWLYGGSGLSMQGDGIGLDEQRYHILSTGEQGWVGEDGHKTIPGAHGWSHGFPFWRGVGWRNKAGYVTYPLADGTWYSGAPKRYIAPKGIVFGVGPSRPLVPWRSVAVDPSLIAMGSRMFVPALCDTPGHGWVVAQDIGGAIIGRHIDLFRPAPAERGTASDVWHDERIWVLPPDVAVPKQLPGCDGTLPVVP